MSLRITIFAAFLVAAFLGLSFHAHSTTAAAEAMSASRPLHAAGR